MNDNKQHEISDEQYEEDKQYEIDKLIDNVGLAINDFMKENEFSVSELEEIYARLIQDLRSGFDKYQSYSARDALRDAVEG